MSILQKIDRKRDFETKKILKKIALVRSALAELKGVSNILPNRGIIINTLALQEAKESSEIENIITTHDALYRSDFARFKFDNQAVKEVYHYAEALMHGFKKVQETGLMTNTDILKIQSILEENEAWFRRLPGTELKNDRTGKTVYIPPQNPQDILHLMDDLEKYINESSESDQDILISLAVIHHQFESIHPFYDGNGRTGRIINILYLVKEKLLDLPILYLSRYINQNKSEYYRLLQSVRTDDAWEEWIYWMLDGIEQTAYQTVRMIHQIKRIMLDQKQKIRAELPKIYSQDLLNNIFKHPYTKIDLLCQDLSISRWTAMKYLNSLVKIGILKKTKKQRESYYINQELYSLLMNHSDTFTTYSDNM